MALKFIHLASFKHWIDFTSEVGFFWKNNDCCFKAHSICQKEIHSLSLVTYLLLLSFCLIQFVSWYITSCFKMFHEKGIKRSNLRVNIASFRQIYITDSFFLLLFCSLLLILGPVHEDILKGEDGI